MEIIINDYTKIIRKKIVLNHVNLKLTGGNIYGFQGKNGCGKTMLMRAITGLIRPTEGYVSINGEKIGKDIDFPQSVGALIENPSFISEYSALDNLKMLASLSGNISEDELLYVLKHVGLENNDVKYRAFSLGMKQKLGIAAAVMGNPELVVLDEPINALDEDSVKRIRMMLLGMKNENRIIIIACHDRDELNYLSDKIIKIQDGKIVEDNMR